MRVFCYVRAYTLQPCRSSALNYKDIRVTSSYSFCVSVTPVVNRSSSLPGSTFRMDRLNLLRLSTPRVFSLQPALFAVSKSSSRGTLVFQHITSWKFMIHVGNLFMDFAKSSHHHQCPYRILENHRQRLRATVKNGAITAALSRP